MKQKEDFYTVDLLNEKKRGRPRKQNSLSDAQRSKIYRDKQRVLKRFNFLEN